MEFRTTIETNEPMLGIRAREFWIRGQQAFLDVMVFDPNACRYSNSSLSQCYTTNENEQSVTITNALCKSNKEPLPLGIFNLRWKKVTFTNL